MKKKIALLAASFTMAFAPLAAAQPADPALEQQVSADEEVSSEPAVISSGHVDMGPHRGEDGSLQLLLRDDSGTEPVWRTPDAVTFGVGEAAELVVPEDDAYDFLKAESGQTVWVVPQTEVADVPWLGWNTQSPTIDDIVGTGVELEILEHRGPGDHSLFIQAGGFSDPDVLWTGAKHDSIFVEPDTHTHANWVFTEPGPHEVTVRATIDAPDGNEYTSDARLQFAVGIDPATYTRPDDSMITEEESDYTWLIFGGVAALVAVVIVALIARATRRKDTAGGAK